MSHQSSVKQMTNTIEVIFFSYLDLPIYEFISFLRCYVTYIRSKYKLKKRKTKIEMSTEYIKAMTNLASVSNFRCVTDNTHCLFAKRAIIFGSPDYNSSISVQKNILLCLPSLIKFVKLADQGESIDAYVIEIRNKNYGSSVESLAALVRIVLTTIAQNDPTGLNVMNMKSINTNMWYFSLSSVPLFLTVQKISQVKTIPHKVYEKK